MCRRSGRDVLVRQVEAIIARADSRPDLRSLDLPLLVLCGRQDAITPLDGHEELARLAPHARLVVLDDCGHLSTWEQPEAVTRELRRWLADEEQAGTGEPDHATGTTSTDPPVGLRGP